MTEKIEHTDRLAENAAQNALEDLMRPTVARAIVGAHTVTWERGVSAAGVPVRRYVLRGGWEVDPQPMPAERPIGRGDVVCFTDRRDGGREWSVGETRVTTAGGLRTIVSMTAPGQDEVAEQAYARADELSVVRRAER